MLKHIFKMFEGSSPQLLAVLAGTVNALADGMQYGWTAPSIPVLQSDDSPFSITANDGLWLESLYMIGGIAGLPFSIYLVDVIGRKKTVLISSVIGICGWILIGAGTNVNYLLAGRFLLGMTADISFNASPMYISEIAHQNIRGFLAGIIYLMMLLGIVVIYSIGPIFSIETAAIVGGSILLFQLIVFPFMPESPYYLLYINKQDKAKRALERLRVDDDVTKELMEIKKAVERQKTEKGRPLDLFLVKSNRRACVIVMLLNNTQHFVGITVLIMNLHEILNHAGSNLLSSSTAGIIFSSLMLIAASAATFTVDRVGRKKLLLLSGVLTSLSLFSIAVFFHMQYLFVDLKSLSWIPMVSVMFYALTFKLGLGIVPIVTTAELFPAKVKGWGLAVSDMVYVVSSSLSIYIYQWVYNCFGIHVAFYMFGVYCLISTFLISKYVPETKGKTLEEIQMILKR